MVLSHMFHCLEHGNFNLFRLVAFGQSSLHLYPPVRIWNTVILIGLPEQRENQLPAQCRTTYTKIVLHVCHLSTHGKVPPAVTFGWQGSSRAACCICIFVLTVKIGLAGEVLFWVIHVWRIILASLQIRRAAFPQGGVPGCSGPSCRFMLRRVSWMKYRSARRIILGPLAGSDKVCRGWGDPIGEDVGEACILVSFSLVLSCVYYLALATSYWPSFTILWRAVTSTAKPIQGWVPFSCWQCALESS